MLVVALTASCAVWQPLPGAGLARPANERLGHARVSLRDGTEIELEATMITRDSIIGFGGESHTRLAIARGDVVTVDARQPDAPKTFIAGGITMLSLIAAWVVAVVISYSGEVT
jgi:hypothetical protein